MVPVLSVFAAVLIGLAYPAVNPDPPPPDLPGAGLTVLFAALLFHLTAARAARRVLAGRDPPAALLGASLVNRAGAVLAYAFLVYGAHWPASVTYLGVADSILLDEALVLMPYFALLALALRAQHGAEVRAGLHSFTREAYLAFHFRQILLPILPLFVFFLLRDGLETASRAGARPVAEALIVHDAYPFVQWIALAALLLALYCAIPFFLRVLWGAYPMPDGPLRRRLVAYSARVGFRARDILVWPTEGNFLNAAVIGPAAPFRYVLLTDALLERLPEDEVEAVLAHEAGHARHRHMLLFFLFTVGYTLMAFLAGAWLEARWPALARNPLLYLGLALATFFLWFGTLFGFLSRRFEQQADVFGATTIGPAAGPPEEHPFVRALEGLARQMGDLREVKGWRHFSLAVRIGYLKRYLTDPAVRRRYRLGSAALLSFFGLLLAGLAAGAVSTVPEQLRAGGPRAALARADWLDTQGDEEGAVAEVLRVFDALSPAATGVAGPDHRQAALRLWERTRAEEAYAARYRRVLDLLTLARLCRANGHHGIAAGVATEAWAVGGDHPTILREMGTALLIIGRPRGAALAFEQARRGLPAGSDEHARCGRLADGTREFAARVAEAEAHHAAGRPAEAAEALRRAAEAARAAGLPVDVRFRGPEER